jgi:hypothetical protein
MILHSEGTAWRGGENVMEKSSGRGRAWLLAAGAKVSLPSSARNASMIEQVNFVKDLEHLCMIRPFWGEIRILVMRRSHTINT